MPSPRRPLDSPKLPASPLSTRPPIQSPAQQQRSALAEAVSSPNGDRVSVSYNSIGLGLLSYDSDDEPRPRARARPESKVQPLQTRKAVISHAGELGTMALPERIHTSGRQTIIDFPSPQLAPYGNSPGILNLPPPASPISPMLASPHVSRFSDRAASSNASIRGLDILSEKKALFRDHDAGDTIPRLRGQRVKSGADFWKRFSTVVRLDEASRTAPSDNQHGWLARDKAKNKKIAIFACILSITIVGAIIFCAIFFTLQSKANAPSSQCNLPTFGTPVSHSNARSATATA